jgi:hypothetical protein
MNPTRGFVTFERHVWEFLSDGVCAEVNRALSRRDRLRALAHIAPLSVCSGQRVRLTRAVSLPLSQLETCVLVAEQHATRFGVRLFQLVLTFVL